MEEHKKIKTIREKLLVSQSEFATMIGVSFETVNRWENNKHQPTYKYRRKIQKLYEKVDDNH